MTSQEEKHWHIAWTIFIRFKELYAFLKDILKAFNDFKSKAKKLWSNAFWYEKVYIFWKFIQYTRYWDEKQILKKISFRQNKCYNKCTLFSYSSTFNLRFLYELKQKVCVSKTVWNFPFLILFCFLLKFICLFNKKHGFFDLKASFKK